ncbi:MAG: glycosyltransferase, partial [Bacteroidota bacterium]
VIAGRVADSTYFKRVRREADRLMLPIQFELDCSKEQLDSLLKMSKFFVHSKSNEHFGIVILEAANAGCLTFVPDSGGPREIITPSVLRFSTGQELVQNVNRILQNDELRASVLSEVRNSLIPFRLSSFRKGLSEIIGFDSVTSKVLLTENQRLRIL